MQDTNTLIPITREDQCIGSTEKRVLQSSIRNTPATSPENYNPYSGIPNLVYLENSNVADKMNINTMHNNQQQAISSLSM